MTISAVAQPPAKRRPGLYRGLRACGLLWLALISLLAGCEALPLVTSPDATPTSELPRGIVIETVTEVPITCAFSEEPYGVVGRAYFDSNANSVFDPSDTPLRGAELVVTFTDGKERRVKTDANGEAEVELTVGTRYDPDPRCRAMTPDVAEVAMRPPRGYELIPAGGEQFLFRKVQK